jgi:hypothetical protein
VAADWLSLFGHRLQPYAVQQGDGSYRWVYMPCTVDLLAAHLGGEVTLALSSTDERGRCRWACLDVDVPGALAQLLVVRAALAKQGLEGLVEASRRGGHLWLFFDELTPTVAVRHVVAAALSQIAAAGVEVPSYELYPDTPAVGALGHAVRLPLGIHRKTAQRYPLFDPEEGVPCVFTRVEKAAAFVLAAPRIAAVQVRMRWEVLAAERVATKADRAKKGVKPTAGGERASGPAPSSSPTADARREQGTGTRSRVIRWVDAHISPLDVLAEFAPESEMRRVGRGYLGWCVFHDDRAPDAATGVAGSPSLYMVQDRHYGWSWRCLSTNCAYAQGPMKHSFRLWQELLGLSVAAAIYEAADRWPEAGQTDEESDNGQDRGGGVEKRSGAAGEEMADREERMERKESDDGLHNPPR